MNEMIRKLRELNPNTKFDTYCLGDMEVIICDTESFRTISFPTGFYFSPVYGLTNYGNEKEKAVKLPMACSPGAFATISA